MKWGVGDFLSALCKNSSHHKMRRAQARFFDFAYTEFVTDEGFSRRIGPRRKSAFMQRQCWGWAMDALGKEIKVLTTQAAFGSFQPPSQVGELGSLDAIKQTAIVIKQLAPRWLELIEVVCGDAQSDVPIDIASASPSGRHAIVLALLCHKLRPKKANNIQTVLGLYLYQGGARRRVIDLFCQCGLTVSYKTLQRRMENLTDEAKRKARVVGQSLAGIVTYDNFNFAEGKRGERTGDSRIMRSITTSLVFRGRGFDDDALRQNMWRPTTFPLSAVAIANGLKLSDIDKQVNLPSPPLACSCDLS
jgi:hypothetical protein